MNNPQTTHFSLLPSLSKSPWGVNVPRMPGVPARDRLHLQAARNSVTGFQVLLACEQDWVLTCDSANWLHPLGFRQRLRLEVSFPGLPSEAIEVLPVGYLPGDDGRLWPEYLERSGTLEVPTGRPQPVYVRLRIPPDLTPGFYPGTVRLWEQFAFENEQPAWQAQIDLQVSPAALPDLVDGEFHLNLWQHLTALARQHRVGLWSDAHFAVIDRYFASLAGLGQKALTVIAGEIPWSGQKCFRDPGYPSYLFEHSVVDVRRTADGSLHCDFSHLDRLLELAARHRIDREIDLFGLINIWIDEEYGFGKPAPDSPDAVRVRCLDETSGGISYLRRADEIQSYIRLLHDHLAEKGLLERVRVFADEPSDLDLYNQRLAFVRQAAPGFKYSAAINHYEFIESAPPELLDAVPVLPLACRDPQQTRLLAERLHARGGLLTWYICCWPPIPNTFMHSPLVEGRLLGWLNHALGLDGFLRWAFCLWPAEPWKRPSWRAPEWYAGDMYFVLPGPDGAPVETLRYEALRSAVQDFELLRLVEASLPRAKAQAVIAQARALILKTADLQDFARVGEVNAAQLYSLSPEDYEAAQILLLNAL
jgi:hypothetical protein